MKVEYLRLKGAALIALVVVATAIFLFLYKLAGGQFPGHNPYTARVVLSEPMNLVQNSDVRIAGVKIGEVDSIQNHDGLAEVTFELDSHAPLYNDATVAVGTKTLVGESYLEITRGTPRTGTLRSGGLLPLRSAQESVPLDKIFDALDPAARAEVRQDLRGLGQGLNGRGTALNQMLGALYPTAQNGMTLMDVLAPERRELAALIDQTGTVMGAIGQRTTQLQSLITGAKATAVAVAARDDRVSAMFRKLPSTLDQARTTLTRLGSFSSGATPVFENLAVAAGALRPVIGELGPTAASARTLFVKLQPFLSAINPVIDELPASTKQLNALLPWVDDVLRQAEPSIVYLTPYYRELGSFFANVGSSTDTRDAVGTVFRAQVALGPEDFTNIPPALRQAEQALLAVGAISKVYGGPKSNPYPLPGSATSTPSAATAFGGTYPRLTASPPSSIERH